jgi:hypothetical protein
MAAFIDRQQLLYALEQLNSDEDGDVLAAARKAQAMVNNAGMTWHDVLVPEPVDEPDVMDNVEHPDDIEDEDDDDGSSNRPSNTKDDTESLKIIERMLAQAMDNADFRDELNGYKEDIAAGEFTDRDRKYLQDLHNRLRTA